MILKKTFFATAFIILSFSGSSEAQGPRDHDMWVKVRTDSIECSGGSDLTISLREFYIVTAPRKLAFGTDKAKVMRERVAACKRILAEKKTAHVFVNVHTAEVLNDTQDGSFVLHGRSSPDWKKFSAKTISCSELRRVEVPSRNFYEANRGMAEGHGTRTGKYYFSVDKRGIVATLSSDYVAKSFGSEVDVGDIRNQCNSAFVQAQETGGDLYVDEKTAEVWPERGFYSRLAKMSESSPADETVKSDSAE